jgi:hypothetical protein
MDPKYEAAHADLYFWIVLRSLILQAAALLGQTHLFHSRSPLMSHIIVPLSTLVPPPGLGPDSVRRV